MLHSIADVDVWWCFMSNLHLIRHLSSHPNSPSGTNKLRLSISTRKSLLKCRHLCYRHIRNRKSSLKHAGQQLTDRSERSGLRRVFSTLIKHGEINSFCLCFPSNLGKEGQGNPQSWVDTTEAGEIRETDW